MTDPGFLADGPLYPYFTTGRKHRYSPKDSSAKRWVCTRCGLVREVHGSDPKEPYLGFTKDKPGEHSHQEPPCLGGKISPSGA